MISKHSALGSFLNSLCSELVSGHAHLMYRKMSGTPLLPAGAGPGRLRFLIGLQRDETIP
jgi:hypothetical protein